ncbi:alcohol dehydrogenase catalytic domain-containing protein [Microlunatus sp. Gsoil 973]|uniref:alcohol dehydrogenase catalytic domain-containing protein n=1 Tax=Microlunatus sp. Gsoil 973 TaxID=2672569 RepID=UPI0012B46851|nr:alcohol dehydrogenase catalytic domain-containing protein [Microlunatus sp. Gsoil 973]QGN33760.1 alcohol dehydrogenase catalytic domain-containing protein [Microlunatus sp. Gsoil 973]
MVSGSEQRMQALTITADGPGVADLPEPEPYGSDLLVDGLLLGVCGTDRGLIARGPQRPPTGQQHLVLGHESLGRVRQAPVGSRFTSGDLVTALVRRPDRVPCAACAAGELDLCDNGLFVERGIRGQDGYGAERYLLDEEYAVPVGRLGLLGVLIEPTSIVAKAWERIDASARRTTGRALIFGAGPIGLLAALLAQHRGYQVHIVDQVVDGPKVEQSTALGATYHRGSDDLTGTFDAIVECSGAFTAAAVNLLSRGGAACYVAHAGADASDPAGRNDARDTRALSGMLIGGNQSIFGIHSSGAAHFAAAQQELEGTDPGWLRGLITGISTLQDFRSALATGPDVIKTVIRLSEDVADDLSGLESTPVQGGWASIKRTDR